ncbi:unnamed protein product [Ascophyllum nodosum]
MDDYEETAPPQHPLLPFRRCSGSSSSDSSLRRRRRRPYRPLLRALAAVLVSLGTATGASTGPAGLRLTGRGNGQGGLGDGRHRDPKQQQRQLEEQKQRGQTMANEWTRPKSRHGGGDNCCRERQQKRTRTITPAFCGDASTTSIAGWGRAKIPPQNQRQIPLVRRCHFPSPARRRRPLGWDGFLQQRLPSSAAAAAASPFVARALPVEQESATSGGDFGGSRQLRHRRRPISRGSAKKAAFLYGKEGIFQALPFPVRITVMGGGNFGLALSLVLARNQIPTTLLVRSDTVADYINTHNEHPNYLKGIKLPRHIVATADPASALKDATYIIHAVPVQYTRNFLENVFEYMPPGAPIMSVSKGIETSTLMLMKDILKEICGQERSYAFLSGPSFAREIAMNQATAVVIASDDPCLANDMAQVMSSPTFRCFTSKDVIGVEVGGAVKNVIALAAGMCEGLGLGTNAMAGLVTRGCGEMRRMAVILGGKSRTLSGLSGVGDTFGTCFGPLSRNRNFGIRLGKGESMKEILASSTEVAEGVDTALALADLIKKIDRSYRIDLKYAIIFGVADILKGERSPKEGLEDLMTMPLRAEMYDSFPE